MPIPGMNFTPRFSLPSQTGMAQQTGPSGLAALLQRPGLREALLAVGSGLMAQADRPGSLGGALGRALPGGVQAFEQGQRRAGFEDLIQGVPEGPRRILELLGADGGGLQLLAQQAFAAPASPVAVGANERLVDPSTGDVLLDALPDEESFSYQKIGDDTIAVLSNGELVDQFKFDVPPDTADADSLRGEFNRSIGEFDQAVEAFVRVQDAATGDPTAAKDLALIFNFMKTIDPGSTVREGEFATAQNAAGVPAMVRNMFNRVREGTRLNPEQRAEFASAAREQIESQRPVFEGRADFYRDIAVRRGLNVDDIIRDPFANLGFAASGAEDLGPFAPLVPR